MKSKLSPLIAAAIFSLLASGCTKKTMASSPTRSAPSTYFDLSGWKLTLPIDSAGGTGGAGGTQLAAQTIATTDVTSGFVDDYFYADANGKLIFTAPSNGAVTTPGSGSDHTRSELREIYTGPGADSSNDWNSGIGGTLKATATVQSVSVNSDEATIAQIHNQSVAFALLMYRPSKNDVALSLYTTLSSGVSQRTSLVSNLNLNDVITYQITYSGNNLAVSVNGVTNNFAVDSSWAGTPMYFKLGAYHAAPNTGNPSGDQTQVAFTSFAVTH